MQISVVEFRSSSLFAWSLSPMFRPPSLWCRKWPCPYRQATPFLFWQGTRSLFKESRVAKRQNVVSWLLRRASLLRKGLPFHFMTSSLSRDLSCVSSSKMTSKMSVNFFNKSTFKMVEGEPTVIPYCHISCNGWNFHGGLHSCIAGTLLSTSRSWCGALQLNSSHSSLKEKYQVDQKSLLTTRTVLCSSMARELPLPLKLKRYWNRHLKKHEQSKDRMTAR